MNPNMNYGQITVSSNPFPKSLNDVFINNKIKGSGTGLISMTANVNLILEALILLEQFSKVDATLD